MLVGLSGSLSICAIVVLPRRSQVGRANAENPSTAQIGCFRPTRKHDEHSSPGSGLVR